MNLDDFKIQINKQLEATQSFEMPVTGITNLHTIKTNSILEKIKKSLQFEIVFGVVFVLVFVCLALLNANKNMSIYFGVFSVVVFAFIIVLLALYKKTSHAIFVGLSVKANLVSLHKLLSKFVIRCFQFTMLLIPICFTSAVFLAFQDAQYPSADGIVHYDVMLPTRYIIMLVVIISVFFIVMYFFTKWYLHKMYGNHIAALKQMIDEIDN